MLAGDQQSTLTLVERRRARILDTCVVNSQSPHSLGCISDDEDTDASDIIVLSFGLNWCVFEGVLLESDDAVLAQGDCDDVGDDMCLGIVELPTSTVYTLHQYITAPTTLTIIEFPAWCDMCRRSRLGNHDCIRLRLNEQRGVGHVCPPHT